MAEHLPHYRANPGTRLHSIAESLAGQELSLAQLQALDPPTYQHLAGELLKQPMDPATHADCIRFEVRHAP